MASQERVRPTMPPHGTTFNAETAELAEQTGLSAGSASSALIVVVSQPLFSEMKRHARHDRVRAEEQRALDEQRALVVQQMLPPARRHELRQDDGDIVVL